MKKKVLIIGGCGFIGHNLAIYLKKKNYKLLVTDSLTVNNYYSHKKGVDKNKNFYLKNLKKFFRLNK